MAVESLENDGSARASTASEENSRDDSYSEHRLTWHQLSQDVFVPAEGIAFQGQDPAPHVAAYKISPEKRAAQVIFAIVACCLASGIIWGFAALKPILIAQGVYEELCPINERSYPDLISVEGTSRLPCAEQDFRLNLFFVSASTLANISTLFAGTALDHAGRRACYLISSALLAAGCIMMGSAFAISKFDGFLVANVFLGVGGTFLFVPSFQLAKAFPKYSGVVVALITGAFDSSAAVFLFYRMAYDASGGRFIPSEFFFGYLAVPIVILVAEFTLMPKNAYHTFPELRNQIKVAQDDTRDAHESDEEITSERVLRRVRSLRADLRQAKLDQIEDLMGDAKERQERVKFEEEREALSGVWGALHGLATHRQMLSPWFILILLLSIVQMLRMNYFIATVRSQYRYMLDSEDKAQAINQFFDAALPIAGVISTPLIGLLLNKLSMLTTLIILTSSIAAIGTLNCLPFLGAGYATVIAFVFFRPLYYSVLSDYVIKVFGFDTFGTIYGAIIFLSGLVNFAQPGLDALTHGFLQQDPTWINAALGLSGTFIAASLTVYVATMGSGFPRKQVQKQFDYERRALLREID